MLLLGAAAVAGAATVLGKEQNRRQLENRIRTIRQTLPRRVDDWDRSPEHPPVSGEAKPVTLTREEMLPWRGKAMVDSNGDAIGTIEEIYLDNDSGDPEWALVAITAPAGGRRFVPLAGVRRRDDALVAPYDKTHVAGAPDLDVGAKLSPQHEQMLYRHYGRDRAHDDS